MLPPRHLKSAGLSFPFYPRLFSLEESLCLRKSVLLKFLSVRSPNTSA